MRYHNITKDDMLNGDGLRVVLWVSGCTHHCPNCQNPITWDIDNGLVFDEVAKQEIFEELNKDYVSGITFSGGDPLHPLNIAPVGKLIREIRQLYPEKTIWLYTGFIYEDIQNLPFISKIDVICDGTFIDALKDENIKWVGSSNQRVIDVKKSIKMNQVVLYERR